LHPTGKYNPYHLTRAPRADAFSPHVIGRIVDEDVDPHAPHAPAPRRAGIFSAADVVPTKNEARKLSRMK
jgi:hypothetical protein